MPCLSQEAKQNEKLMKSAEDDPSDVLYGAIMQLKHVATGKFLSGNSITASQEKSCLRLSLSDGDDNCHFRVMPRFKVRNEGSAAYFTDLLLLESLSLDGYSVHVSDKPYDPDEDAPKVTELR